MSTIAFNIVSGILLGFKISNKVCLCIQTDVYFMTYKEQMCFANYIPFIFQLIIWGRMLDMHERHFRNPFCVFCNTLFWVILQFFIQDIGIYLIAGVRNNNSSVIFRVSSVTFLNYCDYIRHMQAVTQGVHYFVLF